MFPCNAEMVTDLRRALTSPHNIIPLSKKVRNACLGSTKRKQSFVEFGLVPVLMDIVKSYPESSKEAIVVIGSLATCDVTRDDIVSIPDAPQQFWSLVRSSPSLEIAEAAARVLRVIILNRPEWLVKAITSDVDVARLLQSPSDAISRLGARCVIVCCSSSADVGAKLARSRSILELIDSHKHRSDDDALALSILAWKIRCIGSQLSLCSKKNAFYMSCHWKKSSPIRVLSDFWCIALNSGSHQAIFPSTPPTPPPTDASRVRSDGNYVLKWVLNTLSESTSRTKGCQKHQDIELLNQEETTAVREIAGLFMNADPALHSELATALAVYCILKPSRQRAVGMAVGHLVTGLTGDDIPFALAALLAATYEFDTSQGSALTNIRTVLTTIMASQSLRNIVKTVLADQMHSCFSGMVRLVRQLSAGEESLFQLIELGIHTNLTAYVHSNRDALGCLVNLIGGNENLISFACAKDDMIRAIIVAAVDGGNDMGWAFLVNVTATKSIENKKKLIALGLPLARLVSERGLSVLSNLCAGGLEHAALIEQVTGAAITFVASGLDPNFAVDIPIEFLANIAASTDASKLAICNDVRVLNVILRALDSSNAHLRLSAVRCVLNLVWSSDSHGDQHQSSPRSPMLRLVHARVMAAASRSPLRFTGIHSSATSSSTVRQTKLVSHGFLEKLQRLSEEDEDEVVKETALEVVQLLST